MTLGKHFQHARVWLSFQFLVLSTMGFANALPDEHRTNGDKTLEGLQSQSQVARPSVGYFVSDKSSLQAVCISSDGYFLTQASESNALRPWNLSVNGKSYTKVREVRRDRKYNLLLLHVEGSGFEPVKWTEPKALKRGQWLWSFSDQTKSVRIGSVSASTRTIPNSGVILGVRFAPPQEDNFGLLVEEVAQQGPAFFAGLQSQDVIVTIDHRKVLRPNQVKDIIGSKSAGEEVTVHFTRKGRSMECALRLASKDQVMYNWAGEDFANHGSSLRTDNFPKVLQHHLPLLPSDMGGAVFNLEGLAVGINIAKVDRVTNYALPVDIFEKEVMSWIEKDRLSSSQHVRSSSPIHR